MIRKILMLIAAASLFWACGTDMTNEPMKKRVVTRDNPAATFTRPAHPTREAMPDAQSVRNHFPTPVDDGTDGEITPIDTGEDEAPVVDDIEDPVTDDPPVDDDPITEDDPVVDDGPGEIIETEEPELFHLFMVPTTEGPQYISTRPADAGPPDDTGAPDLGTIGPDDPGPPDVTPGPIVGTIRAFSDRELHEMLDELIATKQPDEIIQIVQLPEDFVNFGRKSGSDVLALTTAVTLDSVSADIEGTAAFMITNHEHQCNFSAEFPGWVIAPRTVEVNHGIDTFRLMWDTPGAYAIDVVGTYNVEPDTSFSAISDHVAPVYFLDTILAWNEEASRFEAHLNGLTSDGSPIPITRTTAAARVEGGTMYNVRVEPDADRVWVRITTGYGTPGWQQGSFFLIRSE